MTLKHFAHCGMAAGDHPSCLNLTCVPCLRLMRGLMWMRYPHMIFLLCNRSRVAKKMGVYRPHDNTNCQGDRVASLGQLQNSEGRKNYEKKA